MFSGSITPSKLKIKDRLLASLVIILFIVLLPIALFFLIGFALLSMTILKLKHSKIEKHKRVIFQAIKGRDYTVS